MFDDDRHAAGLRRTSQEGLRQGVAGFALDRLARSRPWAFDAGSIDVPCELVHGEQDTVVPIAHGEHNHELIPNSTLTRFAAHGHLSILTETPKLAARLTAH